MTPEERRAKRIRDGEKRPGGVVAAVRDFLTAKRGTPGDIIRESGYARSSIELALRALRLAGEPALVNLLNGQTERGRKVQERKREEERRAAELREPVDVETLTEKAIKARTPLEAVWR